MRNAGTTIENNFTNGLVTEATGLNFPENAVTETDNCVFDPRSVVYRRPGVNLEPGFVPLTDAPEIGEAISEYLWESVAGNGNLTFFAQQIGSRVLLFNVSGSTSLSSNQAGVIDLYGYAVDPGNVANQRAQFTSGFGRLIVTHPACRPFYISYDQSTSLLSGEGFSILTRDFTGLDPRPLGRLGTNTALHQYNLLNQGWTDNLVSEYHLKTGQYPSDYEVWWLYKGPDPTLPVQEVFLPPQMVNQVLSNQITRGNSLAPNGSVIVDEFYKDRSGVTGQPDLPVISAGLNRPSTCEFHAGRVFFSGVNFGEWSSKVYFSQIVERATQFGLCYQANDPTSEYSPDLLPSDGGVINIPEAGRIYRLWSVNNSLLVFAVNGVWEITGSSGIGFSAIDYTVKKISSAQTISNTSFVGVDGMPLWWGMDGIYIGMSDKNLGSIAIQNVSDEKIKTLYQNILEGSKLYAKGAYNSRTKVVQWLFRSTPATNIADNYTYDRVLNFDVRTKAFYPWSIPITASRGLKGIASLKGQGSTEFDEAVVDNGGIPVLSGVSTPVTVPAEALTTISSEFKYLVRLTASTSTYASLYEDSKYDWVDVPFRSYFTTGYKIRGGAMTKSQPNYVRLFNEGPGQLVFYGRWDFHTMASDSRWSSPQQIDFGQANTAVMTRRLKIRGHGLAYQFTVESYNDAPFNVIGWSGFETSNARP